MRHHQMQAMDLFKLQHFLLPICKVWSAMLQVVAAEVEWLTPG
jgi:hypothetical protein